MKMIIIIVTLMCFLLSLELSAKERSKQRERKQQRQTKVIKKSTPQSRVKSQSPVRKAQRPVIKKSAPQPRVKQQPRSPNLQRPVKSSQRQQRKSSQYRIAENRNVQKQSGNVRKEVRKDVRSVNIPKRDSKVTDKNNYGKTYLNSNNRVNSVRDRNAGKLMDTRESAKRRTVYKGSDKNIRKKHATYKKDKHQLRLHTSKKRRNSIKKYKHRRHTDRYHNQYRHFYNKHFRGSHTRGRWYSGHGHYHYDYRYRHLYNPNQWYDDYYYHSYFDWRWDHGNHWSYGYYNDYYDPYYCPDGFTDFVAGLAIGALIYSW